MKRVIIVLITAITLLQFSCKKEKDDNTYPRIIFEIYDSVINGVLIYNDFYDQIYDTVLVADHDYHNYEVNLMCENIDASIMPIIYATDNYGEYVYKVDTFNNEEIFEKYGISAGGTAIFDLLQIIDTASEDSWNLDLTFDYINKWGRSSMSPWLLNPGGVVHLIAYKNTEPQAVLYLQNVSTQDSLKIRLDASSSWDRESNCFGGINLYSFIIRDSSEDTIANILTGESIVDYTLTEPGNYQVFLKVKDTQNLWSIHHTGSIEEITIPPL